MGDPAWGGVTGSVMNSRGLGTPGHGLVFLCGAGVLACELRAGRAGGDFSGTVSTWHKKLFGGAAGDSCHYVFFHFFLFVGDSVLVANDGAACRHKARDNETCCSTLLECQS